MRQRGLALAPRRLRWPRATVPRGACRTILQFAERQYEHAKHPIRPPRFEEVEARREAKRDAGTLHRARNRGHGRPRGRRP